MKRHLRHLQEQQPRSTQKPRGRNSSQPDSIVLQGGPSPMDMLASAKKPCHGLAPTEAQHSNSVIGKLAESVLDGPEKLAEDPGSPTCGELESMRMRIRGR